MLSSVTTSHHTHCEPFQFLDLTVGAKKRGLTLPQLTSLFILRLLPHHPCGTRRNTSILHRRGYLPHSRRIRSCAATLFRHRTSVPRLGGCSLSPAGSRSSECFVGAASGSLMPGESRCPVNQHALCWSSQVPILLRILGSESTYPLSTLGTKHLSSRRSLPHCLGSSGSLSS